MNLLNISKIKDKFINFSQKLSFIKKTPEQREFDKFIVKNQDHCLLREIYLRLTFISILFTNDLIALFVNKNFAGNNNAIATDKTYDIFFKISFLPIGLAQLWIAKTGRYRPWMKYLFLLIDVLWLGAYLVLPNLLQYTFGSKEFTLEFLRAYNDQKLKWLFVIYSLTALYFSTNYVRALGVYISLFWAMSYLYLSYINAHNNLGIFVDFNITIENISLAILMSIGFTIVAKYHYYLVSQFLTIEQRRSTLSRFFSPNLLEILSNNKITNKKSNVDAAIAFVDIKSFTAYSQQKTPDDILKTLQEFHSLIENEVFKKNGTLEKYIGDAAMVAFGAPIQSPNDADKAAQCAINWLNSIEAWNKLRKSNGDDDLKIGIGLDFGPVTCGTIGQSRNMSYAIVGATVNRASRLENLTREFNADIVISNDFYNSLNNKNIFAENGFEIYSQVTTFKELKNQLVWVISQKATKKAQLKAVI